MVMNWSQCSIEIYIFTYDYSSPCYLLYLGDYGSIKPKIQVAYIGSQVNLYCYSASKPRWLKNDRNITQSHVKKKFKFTILNVTVADSGNYTCSGSLPSGDRFKSYSILFVGSKWYNSGQQLFWGFMKEI